MHSHTRGAVAEEMKPAELRHVMLLAMPTFGLPAAVKVMTWMEEILKNTYYNTIELPRALLVRGASRLN
jgi:alkylhydroperoxidase/carboxymuconolactone decarboxylase family protein YurZ